MLELYHADNSTASQRVRIVLAEKELDWSSHPVDLAAGEQLMPDYLALNPAGEVPTLVVDGYPIRESSVIAEYLEERWPQPALSPADPLERARMRLWIKLAADRLQVATGIITLCVAMRDHFLAMPKAELAARINRIPDEMRRERFRQNIDAGLDSPHLVPAVRTYDQTLVDMNQYLTRAQWLAGHNYSLADAALLPYVNRLALLGFTKLWESRPALEAWLQGASDRASYRIAVSGKTGEKYAAMLLERGARAWPMISRALASV